MLIIILSFFRKYRYPPGSGNTILLCFIFHLAELGLARTQHGVRAGSLVPSQLAVVLLMLSQYMLVQFRTTHKIEEAD
jgi:hypothetical protein